MNNDYLKHYGIKKSKWSPQARAKYDAELRRKYGQKAEVDQRRLNGATTANYGSSGVGKQYPIKVSGTVKGTNGGTNYVDKRLRESGTWNSLTPEQKKRVNTAIDSGARMRKVYKNSFLSGTIGKWTAKFYDNYKKRDVNAIRLKYAEEVKKADDAKSAREAKRRTGSSFGNNGPVANIVKRDPGRKTVGESASNRNDRKQMGRMVTQDLGDPITRNDRKQMGRMVTQDTGTRRSSKGNSLPIGQTIAENLQNGGKQSALPKAGLIFKRPQAKAIGKVAKKNAHRVKANTENQRIADEALSRHINEAEASYAKEQKKREKEDKKAVEEYNKRVKSNAKKYSKQTYTDTDFLGNERTRTYKELKDSKNPFDRISADYKLINTTDNKLVRGLKKAYNSLGFNYNRDTDWKPAGNVTSSNLLYEKGHGSKSSLPKSGIIRRKKAKSIGSAVKKKK